MEKLQIMRKCQIVFVGSLIYGQAVLVSECCKLLKYCRGMWSREIFERPDVL